MTSFVAAADTKAQDRAALAIQVMRKKYELKKTQIPLISARLHDVTLMRKI